MDVHLHSGTTPLLWIHRILAADNHIYFLSNQEDLEVQSKISFRIEGLQPEFWNAVDGTTENAVFWSEKSGRTELDINLPASGSIFVVFRKKYQQKDRILKILSKEAPMAFMTSIKAVGDEPYLLTSANGNYEVDMVSGDKQLMNVIAVPPFY